MPVRAPVQDLDNSSQSLQRRMLFDVALDASELGIVSTSWIRHLACLAGVNGLELRLTMREHNSNERDRF